MTQRQDDPALPPDPGGEGVQGIPAITASVLDRLAVGVVVCDTTGRVVYANEAVRRILDKREGLVVAHQTITASDPEVARMLGRAIEAGASLSDPSADMHTFPVPRTTPAGPLAVLVAPLGDSVHALVLVTDPQEQLDLAVGTLRAVHGLTPSEARVAAELLAGSSVLATAEHLGIAWSTVRTHMKHIFDKTNVSTRSELVRVLLAGPVRLARLVVRR